LKNSLVPIEYQPQFKLVAVIVAAGWYLERQKSYWRYKRMDIVSHEENRYKRKNVVYNPRPQSLLAARALALSGNISILNYRFLDKGI
jgi:hypothetical protein